MTTSPADLHPPIELSGDLDRAARAIEERLRTKSVEQVYAIGERTGWWDEALVDWVFDGRQGPPPMSPAPYTPMPSREALRKEQDQRLEELQHELADRGILVEEADPPAEPVGDLGEQPGDVEPVRADQPAAEIDVQAEPAPDSDTPALPTASSTYVTVLQARDLGVDHSYQRPLDEPRVKRMVAAWDPRMVGVIDVSDRGEGADADGGKRYAVINGQHRAAAAARVSPAGGDVWLPCNVHEGLTVAQEAALMHELDRTTKKLTGFDRWRARRGSGDPVVLEVEAIAAAHGLRVGPEPTDGVMRSYGAAEKLLKLGGPALLDGTLAVLFAAYGTAAAAYQAPLVTGVGQLLHLHPNIDVERLRTALAKTRPEQLRASASSLRDFEDGPLHQLMAMAIATAYNRTPGDGPKISGGR
ncbi:DUF6551 family protein [Blastococcus sp. CCUG 61487]|uniref:DUF6551 family protein n=1 Tax=Blastococcus sp. CCUG 61487 TaxID=1840703 RepID=UPI0010C13DC5|nr:DUF6551 family protein [Blastococcus sp. CCUG 61487]TKJ25241.1 hypothetical protein A6V29_04255 [Blastococcus sp. CCUG 61487]